MTQRMIAGDHLQLLSQVAELYYKANLTQAAIANKLGYSRSMISHLLIEAQQQGIVEIHIHHPLDRCTDLEQALQRRFQLKQVRVLASGKLEHTKMIERLGSLAATVLESFITNKMTVGVSWSRTVATTVDALTPRSVTDLHVVQFTGSAGVPDQDMDGSEIARRLARAYGGRYSTLPAPLIADTPDICNAFLTDRRLKRALITASRMTLAVIGIGTVEPVELNSLIHAGYLTKSDVSEMKRAGVVGDICGHYFDRQGHWITTTFSGRVVGLGTKAIEAVPTKLAIAGGKDKALAILGAAQTGLVNILVTDESAATRVLKLAEGD